GAAPAAPAAACAPAGPEPAGPEPAGPEPAGKVLSPPLVGTNYAASAPDAAPFVTAGAQVAKGQTVCLIEAM
ncbi:acetyl-CoA carboxylase biotin carboxyl carrier protein subunit, partial [Intestinimonas massiliensis]|nr:acetyl-CoA carboxylase biotin carboxyl carrier protein subunit [Intestinimonas massiliensis (ex Afouda et al. 2020)]